MSIGEELKNARRRAGMTQRQLADLSTVGVRTIRDLEYGRTSLPRAKTLSLLLDALRMTGKRRAELEAVARSAMVDESDGPYLPPTAAVRPIIGRERDVQAICKLLRSGDHRLIRVSGAPGVGKSRLIQEVSASAHAELSVPVVFVDLERDAVRGFVDRRAERLTEVLSGAENQLESLLADLGSSRVLLMVAGTGGRPAIEHRLWQIVSRFRDLLVVYESRRWTLVPEATNYPVSPLAVPQGSIDRSDRQRLADAPALQMLRLYDLRPNTWATSDLRTFARICCLLDGVPQALESAASWLLLYEPSELLWLARANPFQLTSSGAGSGRDLRGGFLDLIAEQADRDAALLHGLAGISRPWTVAEAVESLDTSLRPDALSIIHRLYLAGLVRLVGPDQLNEQNEAPLRMIVLNLVRHAIDIVRGSDADQRVTALERVRPI